jgi:hypothetical protein
MYSYQKGTLPLFTTFLGIFIPSIFFIYALKTLLPLFVKSINAQPINIIIENTISLMVGLVLYWALPFFFGIFFSGIFPAIRITEKGISFIYLGGLIRGLILWNEIEKLHELPYEYIALTINRPGLSLFNGLYMNSLYGRLLRAYLPVIILSPTLKNRTNIIEKCK